MQQSHRIINQVLKSSKIFSNHTSRTKPRSIANTTTFVSMQQTSLSGTSLAQSTPFQQAAVSQIKSKDSKSSSSRKVPHTKIGISVLGMFLLFGLTDDG